MPESERLTKSEAESVIVAQAKTIQRLTEALQQESNWARGIAPEEFDKAQELAGACLLPPPSGRAIAQRVIARQEAAIHDLVEAIRLTVEYVGTDVLHPGEGWTWYDALLKHAPEVAARFKAEHEKNLAQRKTANTDPAALAMRISTLEGDYSHLDRRVRALEVSTPTQMVERNPVTQR